MMDPEASVSAIVIHHPEARYFGVSSFDLWRWSDSGSTLSEELPVLRTEPARCQKPWSRAISVTRLGLAEAPV